MTPERIFIAGPEGQLEAELARPTQVGKIAALLCHPHPLYGGSMHDGVLQTAGDACLAENIATLKFNFRGVGASQGISGRGDFSSSLNTDAKLSPEVGDVVAAFKWLTQTEQFNEIWVIGYSFGANMLWQALPELAHLTSAGQNTPPKTLLIAPPNAAMTFSKQQGLREDLIEERISVVAGANDDYVDISALTEHHAIKTQVIADADHFFSGQHQALGKAVTAALKQQLSQ
ncbi:hypothetical protein N9M30_03130 [Pseudomonadales bacterium]|nr:hypothetical protein [Pseudomonadales bacterium]